MITNYFPKNWRDLQKKASKIIHQSGLQVTIAKKLRTVRGKVEIDIYVEEHIKHQKLIILCECKHWKTNVPQSVVHSFRTIMQDIGAHIGYIISSKGFQKGAYKAAKNSNIELLSWPEFQLKFEKQWFDNYFTKEISKIDPLVSYTEPVNIGIFRMVDKMTEEEKKKFFLLRDKYGDFAFLCLSFFHGLDILRQGKTLALPLNKNLKNSTNKINIPKSVLSASSYEDFLREGKKIGKKGIKEFRQLFSKYRK